MVVSEIKGLGYVRVETQHMKSWREFALAGLGFAEGTGPDEGSLYLRLDERTSRIVISPGERDRITGVGWEVADTPAFERVQEQLAAASVPFKVLSQAEADRRKVREVLAFTDPCGTTVEIFDGAVLDHSPLITPYGATFVTGAEGLGHVVLPTTNALEAFDFYTGVLGFSPRGSFRIPTDDETEVKRFEFLGVNRRHHSLAIGPAAADRDPGLIHIMVEVDTLDAVGQALDRVVKDGYSISSTIGRHTNDKMVSFYVRTPGGWDIEFGTGGRLVDQRDYSTEEITADSYWGHDWSASEPLPALQP
ncbi:VOC family protein [Gordonia sp. NPDC127522]|uniref:VOC family protein n=1 Tax=Gordonia sp. NPDC127522 TaxID=3345390 RepID=UPI003628CCB4